MRSRLFVKIYLTVLACLAAVAITSGAFWSFGMDREETGWQARRDAFLAEILPASDTPDELRETLDRLARAFDADIGVYEAGGSLIAAAGTPPAPDKAERGWGHWRDRDRGFIFSADLPGGRVVTARLDEPSRARRNPLAYLALIATVIGLAAYPVVRHLTRRLESLRAGVERFGEGELVARVKIGGKDEVAAVATSFNKAADRIEKLVTAHRTLLANASHELRSPLTRLRMALDLDERGKDDVLRAEMLRNLAELDELVEEILLSSRLDHARTTGDFAEVDLLALAAEEAARHGLDASGDPVSIKGDARLLTRMVRNLVLNALRHGAQPVEIEVRRTGRHVRLSVRDHGPGIPQADAERIFEPFYRPSGHAEAGGGWGLGLALVRQIAQRHGATVRHERPSDGGARFIVDFAPRQADSPTA